MARAHVLPAALLVRPRASADEWLKRALLGALAGILVVSILLPLYALLSRSVRDADGTFVGLARYAEFVATPALAQSIRHSLTVALTSTLAALGLAFGYAYSLTRSRMPLKGLFKGIAAIPILMPSLLPAISLVYLFGNQGLLRGWLLGASIYGPLGIVLGEVFYVFPHALMILLVALATGDARLYEAAESLRASKLRVFFTVTLPGIRYGLVSAFFAVFTLVITDFGVPKVIGGQYNVLATDVYKQVVGRHDFEMGAVVSVVLLVPAAMAFVADRVAQRRQVALLTSRSVPYEPKPNAIRDAALFGFCSLVSLGILTILGTAAFASFVRLWPYNLRLTAYHYHFELRDGGGWDSYLNSLQMAGWTAVAGTALIFGGAYLVERTRGLRLARAAVQFLCMVPMAVPGLVLGLAYIFFFNAPQNPLHVLYHTMAILVLCTIVHFYTVPHLTAVTALKQMDPEFEAVSASLKVPFYRTFRRVTVPVCLPAILDISMYLFLNAMTTVSAVVFLYSPDTSLASVAVLNMDDAGETASAAAMGMMIVYTSIAVRGLHALVTRGVARRSQAWRRRT